MNITCLAKLGWEVSQSPNSLACAFCLDMLGMGTYPSSKMALIFGKTLPKVGKPPTKHHLACG